MPTATIPDIAEIEEAFELLDDWELRFEYLLDLGKRLPPLPDGGKTQANRVHGCQASVWMVMSLHPHDAPHQPRIQLRALSDAFIVNGLIAILLCLYDDKTPAQALAVDAEALFKKLQLDSHLSPTRRNGLHSMITRVRALATAAT